ncbi:hypothetical protein DOY81_014518, partial [Sarcophaga bullata]
MSIEEVLFNVFDPSVRTLSAVAPQQIRYDSMLKKYLKNVSLHKFPEALTAKPTWHARQQSEYGVVLYCSLHREPVRAAKQPATQY